MARQSTLNDAQSRLVEEHMEITQVIALEYGNIPHVSFDEVLSEACQALLSAAAGFDSAKGTFSPYAARAIRNRLNSLYASQVRLAKVFPVSLNSPVADTSTEATLLNRVPDTSANVIIEVRHKQSLQMLEEALAHLPPRLCRVVDGIRKGKSYQEIGDELGITKQGVHKLAKPALEKLRAHLKQCGFSGLDSQGFLASRCITKSNPDAG
jgi:RNA polymerase sigma factor (sigma-70 family)